MGPSRSQQKNVQVINGQTTSTSSITFTYILMATAEGSFTIPGATITAEGNQMVSNSVYVKVLPADRTNGGASGNSGRQSGSASRASSGTSVSNNDLFITATANKTNLYEQEALLLTYKIYTLVDLRGFDNVKLPDFKGFHSQEVELPNDRKWSLEHYKGRNYQTTVYRQFVLFPQQPGKITIDAARFDASIAKVTHVDDPFEAFFNGGSNYVEVKKTLMTPKLVVDVKALPDGKPSGFSGGVGEFSISSSINSTNVKTNDAVTVRLVISGTGNLKLISTPEVKFPEDFEVYDPKVDNKFRLTNAGLSGSQVIEYLAIPRNAGTYKIPAVKFSYFDIKSRTYKTLTTEEYELHVEKGSGNAAQTIANFTNKEDLKVLNEDIRYIKQNNVTLSQKGEDVYKRQTVYRQFVLFPQQPGKITIDAARFDASIAKVTHVDDPFEAFFNGGSNYVEVKKTLMTPKLVVDVKALPDGKPSGFSGGVGEFSISSSINSTNVKTNDAVTVRLVISGTGNLKLISTPEVKFPEDFEVYDPKVDNKFRLTNAGLSGSQVIEYLAIPRNAGTYKIPAVKFSYFDIKSRTYKTLTTEEYELHVEKGSGNAAQTIANFTNKEDLKVLNEDIRYIKQNNVTLSQKGDFFFGSLAYWLFYIVPGIAFVLFFIVYRKQIAANANVAKMRTKKANKVAVKRMKLAGKLLADNKKDAFYDEVLKALWGYISDKLSIPVSRLSKDNVEGELLNYGVDDALIKDFLDALNNCEFARFAPGDDNQAMDKVYSDSLEVISKMENSIKH